MNVSPPNGDQRLADRRLLAALRRLHRREPLKPDQRLDAVLAEARSDPAERRPTGHRGAGSLRAWSDAALAERLDALAAAGRLVREGRRVHLAEHLAAVPDQEMRGRVDRLMDGLREIGAEVPRVDGLAARLGIPPGVVDQLRTAGELVHLGEGIDYPADVLAGLLARIDLAAGHGPLNVARVRDELRVSRRHAEALLRWRSARTAGSSAGGAAGGRARATPAARHRRGRDPRRSP